MKANRLQPTKHGARLNKLNAKQHLFVSHLLASEDFNATQAARMAGYKNPSCVATKLLKNKAICAQVGKKLKERQDALQITDRRVLRELASIAFFDPINLFTKDGMLKDIVDIDERSRRAISGIDVKTTIDQQGNTRVETKLKLCNKLGALELAGKHLGMFTDKFSGTLELGPDIISALLTGLENTPDVIDTKAIESDLDE